MYLSAFFTAITFVSTVLSHGIVTKPIPRGIGPASLAACGPSMTEIIKADNQSGIEVLHKASVTDPAYNAKACVLQVCKGLQLADNLANVQKYAPGEEVNMQVSTRIPHKGWVSVAIVNPKNLFLVGDPLVSFETDSVSGYAVAPVDMDFNVTIPMDLGERCAVPGECVLQWTWFGRVVKQTYESCIDFYVASKDAKHESEEPEGAYLGQKELSE